MNRAEKAAISIAIVALGVSVLSLGRREMEITSLKRVEKQLVDLRTFLKFAEIVENYEQGEAS